MTAATGTAVPTAQGLVLTVNGDRRSVAPGTTLAGLLTALSLDPRMIVVERNREILRDRSTFDAVVLADGDVLELVHFVGGG
ncbi:MAG: sulfur carrier protein ThiS [Gemmatimonadaceae bacterium]|jgi:thiamine biosynthesis protein ThiS|nr:sulfur carrier protein ThiS [Gemmatimonadaceae bacterium]